MQNPIKKRIVMLGECLDSKVFFFSGDSSSICSNAGNVVVHVVDVVDVVHSIFLPRSCKEITIRKFR